MMPVVMAVCQEKSEDRTCFHTGVLSSLAKKLGGNMLLIPSSIHEFLVMPLDSDIDVCNLSEFICEVNSTEVRDEEVLGERYYIYDSKTDTVY